jgi:hypothetical protein
VGIVFNPAAGRRNTHLLVGGSPQRAPLPTPDESEASPAIDGESRVETVIGSGTMAIFSPGLFHLPFRRSSFPGRMEPPAIRPAGSGGCMMEGRSRFCRIGLAHQAQGSPGTKIEAHPSTARPAQGEKVGRKSRTCSSFSKFLIALENIKLILK